MLFRSPFGGRPTSPISLHRYAYGDADPVNNIDPTGQFSVSELSIVQAISGFLKATDTATKLGAGCGALQTLDQVNDLAYAFSIGVSFLGIAGVAANVASDLFSGVRDEAGFSKLGINPQSQAPFFLCLRWRGWARRLLMCRF